MNLETIVEKFKKKTSVLASLKKNKRSQAAEYIKVWSNCSEEEAEEVVNRILDSVEFKDYLEYIQNNEVAIIEQKRKETRSREIIENHKQRERTNEYVQKKQKVNNLGYKANTMVFIDAESVPAKKCSNIMEQVQDVGKIFEIRYYARQNDCSTAAWNDMEQKYGIKPIRIKGKPKHNKIDDKLVTDICQVLTENKSIDVFCIASRDGDFSGIAEELRKVYHKKVVVLAPENTSELLKSWATVVKDI